MKQCPACKTTDQTLRFCLADGNPLTDLSREQETVIQGGSFHDAETIAVGGGPARVEIPRETVQMPAPAFHTAPPAAQKSSGTIFKVILVIIGLGVFAVLAVAVGAFIYFNMNGTEKAANKSSKDVWAGASPTPSPAKDDEEELRDQIANLEKLINEQKTDGEPANIPLSLPDQAKTARVNSPGDGFLALRTLPSSEFGDRIIKIPHGATVSIGICGPVVKPVSRTGRWCQANYNGYSGWVFDAYLIY